MVKGGTVLDLYDILQNHIGIFLLILTRVSGIFIMAPFFGSKNTPAKIRSALSLAITLVLFPTIMASGMKVALPMTLLGYVVAVASELFVGWVIGFVAYLTFAAILMAGQLLDMQVGFGVVNVLDPTSGQQVPLIGSFKYNLALLIFLVTNSHYIVLTALVDSFTIIPIIGMHLTTALTDLMIAMTWGTFTIAIKISIPIIFAIILMDVALGVLARTMPQMNIFVVGVPAKIFVGLFVLSVTLPFYILFLDVAFHEMYTNLYNLLRTLS